MPSNSLSTIFDKTQRLTHSFHPFPRSKSAQASAETVAHQQPTQRHHPGRTEERRQEMTSKYNAASRSTVPIRSVSGPSRFSPVVRAPDELFLRTLERRATNQAKESQRRRSVPSKDVDEVSMSVAIACSLPPEYFERPTQNGSPLFLSHVPTQRRKPVPQSKPSAPRGDELFLKPLCAEIDQTILQYSSGQFKANTPAKVVTRSTHIVSPINRLDRDYLPMIEC